MQTPTTFDHSGRQYR